jgi:hypothetical protein
MKTFSCSLLKMLATNRRILEMEIAAGRAIFVELIYQLP